MATKKTTSKSSSRKTSSSKTKRGTARKNSKRTLIEPHKGDRRYVRRNKKGEFKTEVNVGRSLAADRRTKSKTKVGKGQGDRGDTNTGITGAIKRIFKG